MVAAYAVDSQQVAEYALLQLSYIVFSHRRFGL
jgi:hypothetical protein